MLAKGAPSGSVTKPERELEDACAPVICAANNAQTATTILAITIYSPLINHVRDLREATIFKNESLSPLFPLQWPLFLGEFGF
jgi:hypothetical protein